MKTKLGLLIGLLIGLTAQASEYLNFETNINAKPAVWFGITYGGIADGFSQSTCLQTNVVEFDHDPNSPYNLIRFYRNNGNPPPITEKWVTTTISKKTSLEFDWNGQHRIVSDITGISTNTVHLKIKQDWEEVK